MRNILSNLIAPHKTLRPNWETIFGQSHRAQFDAEPYGDSLFEFFPK